MNGRLLRRVAALAAWVAVAAACVPGAPRVPPPAPPPRPDAALPGAPRVEERAERLCDRPPLRRERPRSEGSTTPVVTEIAGEVEAVRGLRFRRSPRPQAVDQREIGGMLRRALDRSFPARLTERRSRAWGIIGAIPQGTDLRAAIHDFAGSQIIGFYDTLSHHLVFAGNAHAPSPYERMTLVHELTHALDDQHFRLDRLDRLEHECRDERLQAFVSLVEGNAVVTSLLWARRFLTAGDLDHLEQEEADYDPPPPSVPAFVVDLFFSPYRIGPPFVQALLARGGQRAVNDAFRRPPTSTEQVLHPRRFRRDRPRTVRVPDLSEKLGGPWHALDVFEVGEDWLRILLDQRLPAADAATAAAGWDGGEYRAWASGRDSVVLMQTVWDSSRDAGEFAAAMRTWIGRGPASVSFLGRTVTVSFGSGELALRKLEGATG